jgi:hypothetical protein
MGHGIAETHALEAGLRVVLPVSAHQHLVADCWRTGCHSRFGINVYRPSHGYSFSQGMGGCGARGVVDTKAKNASRSKLRSVVVGEDGI